MVTERRTDIIFKTVLGSEPMSGRTKPIPMEDGRFAPARPAFVTVVDEPSIVQLIGSPDIARGHNTDEGLVKGSPVITSLALYQLLERVDPRNGIRTQAPEQWVVSHGTRK
jgi:hypothetical protein